MAKRRAFMLSASQYMQQVRLPPDFIANSRALADSFLQDAIQQYHTHRNDHAGRVDSKQWKLVKDKHNVACYRSLKPSGSSRSGPEILAVGTITGGGLEDVLHGVVNLTPEAMHVENALAQGDLIDSRILAFLSPPTSADPFDSMTVKWVLRNHPSMTKQRDYVYLESAGMTTSPDGESLGFLMAHSVTLTAVPEFHKDSHISRGHLAYCFLFRQRKQHGVDVFFQGTINPLGGVKDRVAIGLTVDMIVNACPASIQLAMMKKLMFCLRKLPTPSDSDVMESRVSQSSSGSDTSGTTSGRRSRSLGSNGSFLRRLTTFSSRSTSYGSGDDMRRTSIFGRAYSHSVDASAFHGSTCHKCRRHFNALKSKAKCHLCHKLVCSRCRVLKRVIAQEGEVMYPEKLDFCTECVSNTSNTSAAWIAAQELHELEEMLDERENPFKPRTSTRESNVSVRKPLWELIPSSDDRQTMSSEFSTRSSTGDRYLVSLTGSGSIAGLDEAARSKHNGTDLEVFGLEDVDEDFSASGHAHKFGEFVLDDSDDEGDEMPIVESFMDDDFFFDASDEILLSVTEEGDE